MAATSEEQPSQELWRSHRRRVLSDDEVEALAECLQDILGQPILDQLRIYGLDPEEHVRFMSVAQYLTERREAEGLDIKTAARQLKVPQYRLRDIEGGRINSIVPDVLTAYIDSLALTSWFGRWKKANPELAARIGLQE
jgi:beta-glucosidase-like glycosyl hydrolase